MNTRKERVKYDTTCSDKNDGSVIIERIFEAGSKDEAETRALINCIKAGNRLDDVVVDAKISRS